MTAPVDTSTAALETIAGQFEDEGQHFEAARAAGDADHAAWCAWMQRSAATLRALAAERDAAVAKTNTMIVQVRHVSRLLGEAQAERDDARAEARRLREALTWVVQRCGPNAPDGIAARAALKGPPA